MLIKSDENQSVLAALLDRSEPVTVKDKGTYWQVEGDDEIVIDATAVSDHLGREVEVDDLLVGFATYVGRIVIDDFQLRVTSTFPQVGRGSEA
jgi:hypothetical protein